MATSSAPPAYLTVVLRSFWAFPSRAMSHSDLRSLLDDVPDTFEIVLRREPDWSPVLGAWRDAAEEARGALAIWQRCRDASSYTAYRAAQDREDAAQDALAQTQTSLISVS
jgi:hypothetical protein